MRRLSALCIAAILVMAGCDDDASYAFIYPDSVDGGTQPTKPDSPKDECQDTCNPEEKKCQDNTSMTCLDNDDDGCYEWVSQDCQEDELCLNGVCTKKSDPPHR